MFSSINCIKWPKATLGSLDPWKIMLSRQINVFFKMINVNEKMLHGQWATISIHTHMSRRMIPII